MAAFGMDEWVLLTSQKGKKWLVKIEEGPYSSHLGTIDMREIPGKEEGEYVETNKGAKIFLFRPTLEDYIFKMKRHTQIIYPKDLGAIVFYGDIAPGETVLESGMGAGALTLTLLRAVGDRGRVISVEKRPEFAALALENIARFHGCRPPNLDIVVADIQDFSMTARVNRIFLDLPEPWHAIRSLGRIITEGGLLVSLSPNVGQVQLMYRELKARSFANISTFEILRREWKFDEIRARPNDRMIGHTGFITVAKKVVQPPPEVPSAADISFEADRELS